MKLSAANALTANNAAARVVRMDLMNLLLLFGDALNGLPQAVERFDQLRELLLVDGMEGGVGGGADGRVEAGQQLHSFFRDAAEDQTAVGGAAAAVDEFLVLEPVDEAC